MPHNYKIHYKLGSILVEEEYNKKLKAHYIQVQKDKHTYEFVINNIWKRKIVQDVDYYQKDNIYCLAIVTKNSTSRPICIENKLSKDISLIKNQDVLKHYKIKNDNSKVNTQFNNITIYNQDSSAFLLWNYKGFYYLNNNITDNLKITDHDVYNLNVIAKLNNLVILADYNEDYHFNKFIIINLENGKKSTWKIDYDISMDSYILGSYNESVFLVNRKAKIEYEIVPSHQKIRIVGTNNKSGIIYDQKFTKISLTKLVQKDYQFQKLNAYNYTANNGNLYLKLYNSDNKILVSKKENLKIVDYDQENIYYLCDSKLYRYNPNLGEQLLLENFEWNFNYQNMIFVYRQ